MTDYVPSNIKVSDDDLLIAKSILSSDKNYNVRYLRTWPTVNVASVPVRDQAGAILEDVEWRKKRIICSGVPQACLIAVDTGTKLLIGWSKRLAEKKVVGNQDMHVLFKKVLEDTRDIHEDTKQYQDSFEKFCAALLSVIPTKDIEIAFSKSTGRTSATLRALLDTITLHEKYAVSNCSGIIPNDIAKNLSWFIEASERRFGKTAANVTKSGMALTKPAETAVTS